VAAAHCRAPLLVLAKNGRDYAGTTSRQREGWRWWCRGREEEREVVVRRL
jgi:hypothetical protein